MKGMLNHYFKVVLEEKVKRKWHNTLYGNRGSVKLKALYVTKYSKMPMYNG